VNTIIETERSQAAATYRRRHVSTLERLADEIVTLLGNDMPDSAAHRRWLLTLGVEKLEERLRILREQSEADDGAAREIRLQSTRWQDAGQKLLLFSSAR